MNVNVNVNSEWFVLQMRRAIDLIHFVIREGMSPDQVIFMMMMMMMKHQGEDKPRD